MTANKNEKRRARERMARTGESYQAALMAMRAGKPEPLRMAGPIKPAEEHCMRDPSPVGACAGPGRCDCECNVCQGPV